jgi:hypothetical protein
MKTTRHTWLNTFLVVTLCALGISQLAPGQDSNRQGVSVRSIYTIFDHPVYLPPGDPRRVTLPDLQSGTVIIVEVLPQVADAGAPVHSVGVEILRRTRQTNQTAGVSLYESAHLAKGRHEEPIRFPVKVDGNYLVAVRCDEDAESGASVRLRVQVDRQNSRAAKATVYTLPDDTRVAVAVFSAGLLWTTLLLCGVPIIRAFRSRRRNATPPWFS